MKSTIHSLIQAACLTLCATLFVPVHLRAEVALEGAEIGKWTMDYDAAAKLAAEKKLPMLLNFTGSDWCGWCKLMDKKVFATQEWQDYAAKNVILVTVDFPNDKSIVPAKYKERNDSLQRSFGIQGYPTYVVLEDDNETELGRLGAGQDITPEQFIQQFEATTRMRAASIAKKVQELGDEKGSQYTKAIAEMKAVEKEFKAWIETRPERNDENTKKFEGFLSRYKSAKAKVESF